MAWAVEAGTKFVSKDSLRSTFVKAMSNLYAREVPLYGDLLALTARVNAVHTPRSGVIENAALLPNDYERHGAIRVGTGAELNLLRRAFALMGMEPVGYYDLSLAGLPVHSTAFRPVERAHLAACPFRVFTSLLRLEFIKDLAVRQSVADILVARDILTDKAHALIAKAEGEGGLSERDAPEFIAEFLQTFVWHGRSTVSASQYEVLKAIHPLVADIVAFPSPHINHLTPAIADIDAAQAQMKMQGLPTKAVIEGPPRRKCPILLRQTSFKALSEAVEFTDGAGAHTARFGEIEERGAALTAKGQALYDRLLGQTRANITPRGDGSNAVEYVQELTHQFETFPDDWGILEAEGLCYFTDADGASIPVKYEDFLPVSAAGIFLSNLASDVDFTRSVRPVQAEFETHLQRAVLNKYASYGGKSSYFKEKQN